MNNSLICAGITRTMHETAIINRNARLSAIIVTSPCNLCVKHPKQIIYLKPIPKLPPLPHIRFIRQDVFLDTRSSAEYFLGVKSELEFRKHGD